jgi:hypothetical protein
MAAATAPHPPGSTSQPVRAGDWLARVPGGSPRDVFHVPISLLA